MNTPYEFEGNDDAGAGAGAVDAALATWAARHAPTAEHLEAIRRAVLDEAMAAGELGVCEAVLPIDWWERFFRDLQLSLSRAACPTPMMTGGAVIA